MYHYPQRAQHSSPPPPVPVLRGCTVYSTYRIAYGLSLFCCAGVMHSNDTILLHSSTYDALHSILLCSIYVVYYICVYTLRVSLDSCSTHSELR